MRDYEFTFRRTVVQEYAVRITAENLLQAIRFANRLDTDAIPFDRFLPDESVEWVSCHEYAGASSTEPEVVI